MARITVEDCLNRIENRFLLVNMVAKRVRQIREGSEYLVNSPKNEDIVVSLREIAAGKIVLKTEDDSVIDKIKELKNELQDSGDSTSEIANSEDQETAKEAEE